MFTLPTTSYRTRNWFVNKQRDQLMRAYSSVEMPVTTKEQLRKLGVTKLALRTTDFQYLPQVLQQDETLGGVVYGWHASGFIILAATDKRIIFLDKKPFFVNEDDISFQVVSGVSLGSVRPLSTVTLHTRVKDYTVKTLNSRCAEQFARFVEQRCIKSNRNWGSYDY